MISKTPILRSIQKLPSSMRITEFETGLLLEIGCCVIILRSSSSKNGGFHLDDRGVVTGVEYKLKFVGLIGIVDIELG